MNKLNKDRDKLQAVKTGKKHFANVAAMSPEARARAKEDEERQIAQFLRERGVSKCASSWAGGSQFSTQFGTDL